MSRPSVPKRLLRDRRAISTPVASLLMIVLIAEAVAFQTSMVAMNWEWQQALEGSNEYARQRLAECLVLSDATVSPSGANVTLTFTNIGSIVAYIHHIWVISITDSSIHKSFTLGSLVPVPSGATVTFNLYPSPAIDPAKAYYFKAVTIRGNIVQIRYPSGSAPTTSSDMISGNLKIAYQGTYNSASDSCHQEARIVLTGISGVQGGSLSFVNPWLTKAVLTSADTGDTTMYYLVNATNTKNTSIVASAGTIDLTWYGSNHITGPLFGVYYLGQFYTPGSAPTITPGTQFYAIFKIDRVDLSGMPGNVFFIGSAAITNNVRGATYYSAQLAMDGLWVRSSC